MVVNSVYRVGVAISLANTLGCIIGFDCHTLLTMFKDTQAILILPFGVVF